MIEPSAPIIPCDQDCCVPPVAARRVADRVHDGRYPTWFTGDSPISRVVAVSACRRDPRDVGQFTGLDVGQYLRWLVDYVCPARAGTLSCHDWFTNVLYRVRGRPDRRNSNSV